MSSSSQEPVAQPAPAQATVVFNLRASSDGLRLLLTSPDPGDDATEMLDRIMEQVPFLEMEKDPSREDVEARVRGGHERGDDIVDLILAEGRAPGQSLDGRIEWARDFFAQGFAVDSETETIDYWERLENLSIDETDTIAVIHAPVRGSEGLSLYGTPVPSHKPTPAEIRYGGNVKLVEEDDGSTVARAMISGRIRWVQGTLSVDDVYTIGRDVDMENGNVDHAGALVIRGDICQGARVHAKGDIIVEGVIEPSDVKCGGNLVVRGGVVGGLGHAVAADGDLQARYILDAEVEVGGDVTIVKEILNSQVRARGEVHVAAGRIAGGCVDALKGLEAGRIGADGMAKTSLVVGRDAELIEKIVGLKKQIDELEARHKKIELVIGKAGRGEIPSGKDAQQIVETLRREAKVTTDKIASTQTSLEYAQEEDQVNRRAQIHVLKILHADTTLEIHRDRMVVRETVRRPHTVSLEKRDIVIGPFVQKRRRITKD